MARPIVKNSLISLLLAISLDDIVRPSNYMVL
jgi:hypothetical protein